MILKTHESLKIVCENIFLEIYDDQKIYELLVNYILVLLIVFEAASTETEKMLTIIFKGVQREGLKSGIDSDIRNSPKNI